MGQIFISYSRKDINTVNEIVARLKSLGFDVWIDREGIKGGTLWRVEIVEAIDNADAFVLMLSPNSAASDNVRKEVDLAESSNRKLFPVLLAAVNLPPQLRYQLAGIQWLDYASSPEEKLNELVEVLRAHQQNIAAAKRDDGTKRVEVVIEGVNIANFGAKEREKLLSFMAEITATPRAQLSLGNLAPGSVRAFIRMPAHSAYILKTAALNQDARLVRYGIHAVRLEGARNYVLVKAGKFGPLQAKPKPRTSWFPRLLAGTVSLALVIAAIVFLPPVINTFFKPTVTPRPPATLILVTPTRTPTPSSTPALDITITPTLTFTSTATATPTDTATATSTETPFFIIAEPIIPDAGVLYDFVKEASNAAWRTCDDSSCGNSYYETSIKFNAPGDSTDGMARYTTDYLEDGTYYNVLYTHPKWIDYGKVRGFYNTSLVTIQSGDRFTAKVGFLQNGYSLDGVTYNLYFSPGGTLPGDVDISSGYNLILLGEHPHQYNKQLDEWSVSLDNIVGQSGWFILEVYAGKFSNSDWATWVEARLERP